MAPKTGLYKKLASSYGVDELNGQRRFIPADVIENVITRESIKAELGRNSGRINTSSCLANKIVKRNARRLFVILVFINESWTIRKFLKDGLTDDDLPFESHDESTRSVHNHTKMFHPPEDWAYATVDEFLTRQWMVLAPIFSIPPPSIPLLQRSEVYAPAIMTKLIQGKCSNKTCCLTQKVRYLKPRPSQL
jgi:hypothetical protein